MATIGYVTDCEGNLRYFNDYVARSHVLYYGREKDGLKLFLRPNCHFVFGGDVCDKGPGSVRLIQLLLSLKIRYPKEVTLILGNRDINKMRFTSELADSEVKRLDLEGPSWVPANKRVSPVDWLKKHISKVEGISADKITEAKLRQYNTKPNRLRWMLEDTMGSAGDFENRKKELAIQHHGRENVTEDEINEIKDDKVTLNYYTSVTTGGDLQRYLEHGQLAHIIKDTLFVHGGILGKFKLEEEDFSHCLGFVPRGKSGQWFTDVRTWVRELNHWLQEQLAEWQLRPTWSDANHTSRGGHDLMQYVVPGCKPSVVMGRHLDAKSMPLREFPYEVAEQLHVAGIKRIILGHTPHGNAPTIIPTGHSLPKNAAVQQIHTFPKLMVVMADTSYSDMTADDNRGDAVAAVLIKPDGLIVEGVLEKKQPIRYTLTERTFALAPLHKHDASSDEESGDPYIGKLLDFGDADSKDQWFVKSRIIAAALTQPQPHMNSPGYAQPRYQLCKLEGYKVSYKLRSENDLWQSLNGEMQETVHWSPTHAAIDQLHFEKQHSHSPLEYTVALHDFFKLLDEDGNGSVDLGEFRKGMRKLTSSAQGKVLGLSCEIMCKLFVEMAPTYAHNGTLTFAQLCTLHTNLLSNQQGGQPQNSSNASTKIAQVENEIVSLETQMKELQAQLAAKREEHKLLTQRPN